MNNFYVIEIQTNTDGTSGNFVWGFSNRNEAEAKFHSAAAYAAQSTVLVHTVVMLSKEGNLLKNDYYIHPAEPEQKSEVTEE